MLQAVEEALQAELQQQIRVGLAVGGVDETRDHREVAGGRHGRQPALPGLHPFLFRQSGLRLGLRLLRQVARGAADAIGEQLAGADMPVLLFTGIATGTVYMQGIEDRAAAGRVQPDYAQDVRTLNYVVAVRLVNTLVAATVRRRREFAQQRLAGATRGQVVAVALTAVAMVQTTRRAIRGPATAAAGV
jgi:hypothetical protein